MKPETADVDALRRDLRGPLKLPKDPGVWAGRLTGSKTKPNRCFLPYL